MRNVLLVAILCFPRLGFAQSIELFVATGAVQLWDDEGSLGLGLPVAGGVGFRSSHGWGVEALIEGQQAKRRFGGPNDVRFDSTVVAGRARLLKYFGNGRTQAYAGGGSGITRIKSTYDYPADCALSPSNQFHCANRDLHRSTSTSGTLSGLAGVRIAVGEHLFVRPEFELSRAGEYLRIGGIVAMGAAW